MEVWGTSEATVRANWRIGEKNNDIWPNETLNMGVGNIGTHRHLA